MKPKSDQAIERLLSLPVEEITRYKDKFFSRVRITGDDCWNYRAVDQRGYGLIPVRLNDDEWPKVKAHRLAWVLTHNQKIPAGMVICHRCDNPACINPAHLFIGTQKDNVADMMAKGRAVFYMSREDRPTKITEQDVRDIRQRNTPHRTEAERYGLSYTYIYNIRAGLKWKHVA